MYIHIHVYVQTGTKGFRALILQKIWGATNGSLKRIKMLPCSQIGTCIFTDSHLTHLFLVFYGMAALNLT